MSIQATPREQSVIRPAADWQTVHEYEDITFTKAEGIGRIAINRPEVHNAFRPGTTMELIDAFMRAREDEEIGVVILTGEGGSAFCSGGDQRARRVRGDAAALARSIRHAGTGAQAWVGEHLHKITAPVLLIAGSLDEKYAAIARELRGALPNARCAIVDGAGHNVHLEKPDEFISLVDGFLSMQESAFTLPN